jgi:hypothetical protein
MLHLPILRRGRPYRSVEAVRVPHFRTKETFVELSAANAGLVRRDLLEEDQASMRAPLEALTTRELVGLCGRAAEGWSAPRSPRWWRWRARRRARCPTPFRAPRPPIS